MLYHLKIMMLTVLCAAMVMIPGVQAQDDADAGTPEVAVEKKSLGHKLLMYIPNRLVDIVDMFRFRVRVGPGASVHVRATELLNGFAGQHNTVYAGLPGPREPDTRRMRSPAGREQVKGFMLLGVDATDDSRHDPGYSPSELAVGAQILIVGAEVGIDPVEIGDFLAGFLLMDPKGDDF